jgi:large subunit ribosomal protein L4
MSKLNVVDMKGVTVGEFDVPDAVLERRRGEQAVHDVVVAYRAGLRAGSASTLGKGAVAGSNKKPWRQKGTGRARAGRRRSPLWVGGGKIFGPQPHDFHYAVPRKVKRVAIRSILSLACREDRIKIVEDFDITTGKTKDLAQILDRLSDKQNTVMILDSENAQKIRRAGGNIPWLTMLSYNRLRAVDMFYGRNLLILESAARKLDEFYRQ